MVMGEQTLQTQVAVVGGGPAGYAAAFRAADLGFEVALINQEERLGGVCLLRGCIPSKVLMTLTQIIGDVREADGWGIRFGEPEIDIDEVRSTKRKIVDRLVRGLETLVEKRDIELVQARAVFESSDRIRIDHPDIAHIQFDHAILATGSLPLTLRGEEDVRHGRLISSTKALDLPVLPEQVLVVGGSYSGLEIAERYALLGSEVTVVEMKDRLIAAADPDLAKPLVRRMRRILADIQTETKVTKAEEHDDRVVVSFEGEWEGERDFDYVITAIGRTPNTSDIGLENTEVDLDDDGFVIVDEEMRSSDEHIFAAGDVVGQPMLAHKAMYHGKTAAEVIAGEPAAYDVRCIPKVVYTSPEIAWCGLTEVEAERQGREVRIREFPWQASGRARTLGVPQGLTKMLFDPETSRVLGVGVVGRNAEDLISEGALAVEMGAVAEDVARTLHAHPTLAETESEVAEAFFGMATHIMSKRAE